jgi:uncharacterized RDD family membrane protein YckC
MTETSEKIAVKAEREKRVKAPSLFNPHETARVDSLAGAPLATFKQRLIAFAIDSFILTLLMFPFAVAFQLGFNEMLHPTKGAIHLPGVNFHYDATKKDAKDKGPLKATPSTTYTEGKPEENENKFFDAVFALLYFGLIVWWTNGQTPGKKLMRIRVVSLTHEKITLWQSCERALGYGASALEAGFGFFQYFIYPNRTCVHDRIAETIVVQEPKPAPKSEPEES